MNRFLVIHDNKIVAERYAVSIVEGEIQDDGTYGKFGQVLIDGVWVDDPTEIAENAKQARIIELKEIIVNKKLLDMDCTLEQIELKTLLGL